MPNVSDDLVKLLGECKEDIFEAHYYAMDDNLDDTVENLKQAADKLLELLDGLSTND